MRSTLFVIAMTSVMLPATAVAEPTAAEVEAAQATYQRAVEAFQDGRHAEAADLFRKSYNIIAEPELLYNEAVARARAGDLAAARRVSDEALRLDLPPRVEAKIEGRLAGWHTLSSSQRVTALPPMVEASDREDLTVEDDTAAPAPAKHSNGLRVVSYVIGGLGVAGLATAGAMELQLQKTANDLQAASDTRNEAAYDDALAKGFTYQQVSRVALVGGVVLLATGVILWLASSDKDEPAPVVGFRF